MTDAELHILLQKYKNGTCSNEELQQIDHWYISLNEGADKQLPKKIILKEEQYLNENFRQLAQRINKPSISLKTNRRNVFLYYKNYLLKAVAAVIFLGITIFYLWKQHNVISDNKNNIVENIVTGNAKEIKKIILPDKSIVWLKGKSKLSYPSIFKDRIRSVTLQGEALFEVSKDRSHPFVIHSGKFLTRVLGTSFNLRVDEINQVLNLVVLTGKVMVTQSNKPKSAEPIYITPGKGLYATINGNKKVYNFLSSDTSFQKKLIEGTQYDMNFENLSFDIIKKRIEDKFNVSIIANDDLYKNCFISADLTDQSLDNSLKILSIVLGAKYSIKNKYIYLTGGGCN